MANTRIAARVARRLNRIRARVRAARTYAKHFSGVEAQFTSRVYRGTNGWNNFSIPMSQDKKSGVHVTGFEPRGRENEHDSHDSIVQHVKSASTSRYVSYGHTSHAAKAFCRPVSIFPTKVVLIPSFVHETNLPLFHAVPAEVVPTLAQTRPDGMEIISYSQGEGEISGIGPMSASDIARSRQVDSALIACSLVGSVIGLPFLDPVSQLLPYALTGIQAGIFLQKHYVGPVIANPEFKSRDFSFRCVSKCEAEYNTYVALDNNIPEGFQALSYKAAKVLHPVLMEMEQLCASEPNAFGFHLVIDCMVRDDTANMAHTIALIQEAYYTMRAEQVEKPFHTIKLSSLISQALELQRHYTEFFGFFQHDKKNSLSAIVEEVAEQVNTNKNKAF